MLIRSFQESDLPALLSLHKRALQAANAYKGEGPWDDDLKDIRGNYLDGTGDFLIGELDGKLVAMGAFRRIDDSTAEIKRMRTELNLQGKGLGRQIYLALEKRIREMGYERIILETSIYQHAALKLYRAMGFVETHPEVIDGLPCIWFEKKLV